MTENHDAHLSPDFQQEEIHQLNRLSIGSQEDNRTNFRQTFDFRTNSDIVTNQKLVEK
jgi:hypothetical protein